MGSVTEGEAKSEKARRKRRASWKRLLSESRQSGMNMHIMRALSIWSPALAPMIMLVSNA